MNELRNIQQSRRRLVYADKIAGDIIDSDPGIERVAVFGSTVEGGEHCASSDSDIDLLTIWSDGTPEEIMIKHSQVQEVKMRDGDFEISITPMLSGEWENPDKRFHQIVKDTAVILEERK